MLNGVHFISGLPRSGSTLLAGILLQNPHFHAGMTSPVGAMYMALEASMSRRHETSVFIEEAQRRAILKGLFTSYYEQVHSQKLVFDTNRAWTIKLNAIAQLFPQARVICCVRDIAWIIDSVERLVRGNAFEVSGLFGFDPGGTVFSRSNRLASSDGLVGYALDGLREAFYSELASRLILVEYEALCREPGLVMQHLYRLLDVPYFEHDFENVEYQAEDFDLQLGAPGLHRVRRRVAWTPRQTVLPPIVFARFADDMFWRTAEAGRRGVPIIGYGRAE